MNTDIENGIKSTIGFILFIGLFTPMVPVAGGILFMWYLYEQGAFDK